MLASYDFNYILSMIFVFGRQRGVPTMRLIIQNFLRLIILARE